MHRTVPHNNKNMQSKMAIVPGLRTPNVGDEGDLSLSPGVLAWETERKTMSLARMGNRK